MNLAARVRQHCHRNHAGRFDSMTFDAFAKGLLDRFGQALPDRWRPRPGYEVMFSGDRDYRDFLYQQAGVPPKSVGTYGDLQAVTVKAFERTHLVGAPLPVDGWPNPTPGQWAADRFWQTSLHAGKKSYLSFPMIGRLAELLLRVNPMARDALRLTYSHLFMDEFQDTTQIQYDLVRTIFLGSSAVITAVGDNKQQIMRWAMAMDDPFSTFDADFGAKRTPLYNNYRSSPELVRIQHILAQALDARTVAPVSKTVGTIAGDNCTIWDFATPEIEAQRLAKFVATEMKRYQLGPRDFVLLVRQKAADYATILEPAFAAVGIPLRNEAGTAGSVILQELLAEEASKLLVLVLRLATTRRAGRYWALCQEALTALRGICPDDDGAQSKLARDLDTYAAKLIIDHPEPPKAKADARCVIDKVLDFIGRERLIAAHPAYSQGDWFAKVVDAATTHLLRSSTGAADWAAALDAYEGLHAIPLMTIHKSKGLEYHSVIFVGLDDGAWWSFADDQIEATAGFFVAFTRAEQVKTLEIGDGRVELRAVTGPDYGRIFDHELVAAVQRIAGNGTGDTRWKVPGVLDWSTGVYNPCIDVTQDTTTLYASDRDVFLFLVDDLNPIEAGQLPDGSPDLYFRGFYCWNSEVGAKTLGIASFYLRAVCQNRNLWGVEDFEEITIRHSKYAASRFAHEVAPALTRFANSSPMPFINGIKAAREKIVARTDEDRSDFLRKRGFSKTETAKIIETVLAEEGHAPTSVFDFVQGITAVARDKTHQDARLDLEARAKKLLDRAA